MIQCQTCSQTNTDEAHFCRFCGARFSVRHPQGYEQNPPRPYAWQTDEYQTQSEPRPRPAVNKTRPIHDQPQMFHGYGVPPQPNQMIYHGPQHLAGNYRCQFCGTNSPPIIERRISTAGWITFALLLVFTLFFFWIGLLLKEDVYVCPVCRRQVS
jgi:hypothetical protein